MSILSTLRKKPRAVRQNYALGGAVGITLVITIVWFSTLSDRYQIAAIEDSVEETGGAFKHFFVSVKSQFASIKTAVESIPAATENGGVATTTEPASTTPAIVVPTLSDQEIRNLNPRTILIATSSNASTTSP